jgi:hypothetical protein
MLAQDERPRKLSAGHQPGFLTITTDRTTRPNTVKAGLTPTRRGRQVENNEYSAFVRRILRAYSRVGEGAVEALALMLNLANELDAAIAEAVKGLHQRRLLGRDQLPARHHSPSRTATMGNAVLT